MVLKTSTFAEDANGNEVFLSEGAQISEISDAGPVETATHPYPTAEWTTTGWNVSFKVKHSDMPVEEIVTMDAVKLLKALDGQA